MLLFVRVVVVEVDAVDICSLAGTFFVLVFA